MDFWVRLGEQSPELSVVPRWNPGSSKPNEARQPKSNIKLLLIAFLDKEHRVSATRSDDHSACLQRHLAALALLSAREGPMLWQDNAPTHNACMSISQLVSDRVSDIVALQEPFCLQRIAWPAWLAQFSLSVSKLRRIIYGTRFSDQEACVDEMKTYSWRIFSGAHGSVTEQNDGVINWTRGKILEGENLWLMYIFVTIFLWSHTGNFLIQLVYRLILFCAIAIHVKQWALRYNSCKRVETSKGCIYSVARHSSDKTMWQPYTISSIWWQLWGRSSFRCCSCTFGYNFHTKTQDFS